MPHQQINKKVSYHLQPIILLPLAAMILSKKSTDLEETRGHSLDFHVEMIKKIDKLLKEHDLEAQVSNPCEEQPANSTSEQAPVEMREPVHRQIGHIEVCSKPPIDSFFTRNVPTPEEFKTEFPLSMNPAIKFVANLDDIDDNSEISKRERNRVEVIDVNSFMFETDPTEKIRFPAFGKKPSQQIPFVNKTMDVQQKPRDKIEVVDTETFTAKKWDSAFFTAMQQTEKNEQKSQLYYLISKSQKEKNLKKLELDRSYIPVDFEERSKQLKEKQEREEEKQEEAIKEKEKKQKKEERAEKQEEPPKKQKEKKPEKKPMKTQKNLISTVSEKEKKKLEKERMRLEKLEAKKAKLEEKQRLKDEKKALKQQQKQTKTKQKPTSEKPTKEKGKFNLWKKEKPEEIFQVDEDLRKVLVMTDTLLGELPEDVIDRFTQSEDFALYEKVLNKYKIK